MCFSDKESTCNAGDTSSVPGLGRPPGEGNSNPLQYSCPWTWTRILAWEIPWTEESGRLQSMGLQRVRQDLVTKQQTRLSSFTDSMTFSHEELLETV